MNKTITPFVFAAALLVAMLASTGIAHAQGTPKNSLHRWPDGNRGRLFWGYPKWG